MARQYIDCRELGPGCSVAISADTEKDLMEAAVEHAVKHHGYQDSPDLRAKLGSMFHTGTPPEKVQQKAA